MDPSRPKRKLARPGCSSLHKLTASEREVYKLVGLGLTNKEIGDILFISPLTVRTHVKRIHAKTDIVGRAKLAIESFKKHWMAPNKFAGAIELLKYKGVSGANEEAIRILEEIGSREAVKQDEKLLGYDGN